MRYKYADEAQKAIERLDGFPPILLITFSVCSSTSPYRIVLPDTIVEISHMICGKSQVLPFQAATWLNLCGRSPSS